MKIIKRLFFIYFILCYSHAVNAVMTDNEFFNCINLNYPGLNDVNNALISGDTVLAKQKLLTYYQTRTNVQYFPLSSGGSVSQANDNVNHYFTVVNIRKYAGAPDSTIDWTTYDPVSTEWHYQFHRMYWLSNFGKVYGSTGNEVYAAEWMAELVDWVNDNNSGYPRTLDTGIRLKNWVESYQYFIHEYVSSSINPEDHVTILKSLTEQCRFLRDNWRSTGNWGASETQGLGYVMVMFPEFKFTPNGNWEWWRDLIISRLDHHLSNDFYSDGVQFETSPSYHSLEYRNLFLTYKIMDMNGISISNNLITKFEKPLEFMMHIHEPDGYLPQLSDTDRKSYLNRLEEGAQLFNRQDMLYAATRGVQGTPPENTFAAFPYGGYFVMRSDWGQNQTNYNNTRYLVFDTGSNEPWHAHYDILNFEAFAYGKTIIKDPGKYAYTNRRLEYYKKTIAHNTIVIDNQDQTENSSGVPFQWETLPGFDYVDGYHDAYSNVCHRRKIFFVKPEYWIVLDLITGSGSHTYDQYFHLEPAYLNHTTLNPTDNSMSTPNFIILPGDQQATVAIVPGWVSYSVGTEQDAPTVKYSKQGSAPVTFETIIFPFSGNPVAVSVLKIDVYNDLGWYLLDDEAIAMKIDFSNLTDYFCLNHSGEDSLIFNNFGFSGIAANIRKNSSGDIGNFNLLNGKSFYKGDTLLIDTYDILSNVSWFNQAVYVESDNIQTAKIWAPMADSVIVNGNNISFVQNGNYVEFTVTAIRDANNSGDEKANTFALKQNYPNPFNPKTVISYQLPMNSEVELSIYNIFGQRVTRLVYEKQPAGFYKVEWDASNFATGVYYYKITAGEYMKTRKLLFLK